MKRCVVFLVFAAACLASAQDLELTFTAHTLPNGSSGLAPASDGDQATMAALFEQHIYVHGMAQRVDYSGFPGGAWFFFDSWVRGLPANTAEYQVRRPHTVVIAHCDTGIVDELDLDGHEYREFRQPKYLSEKEFDKYLKRARRISEKGMKASTVDTGETRMAFGHTARHLVTTMQRNVDTYVDRRERWVRAKVVEVIDGWYFDQPQPGCAPEYLRRQAGQFVTDRFAVNDEPLVPKWYGFRAYSPGPWWAGNPIGAFPFGVRVVTREDPPPDDLKTSLVYTGFMPSGLAIEQTIVTKKTLPATRRFPAEEQDRESWSLTITQYSEAPLDPSLFEVPPGFKKVDSLYRHQRFW